MAWDKFCCALSQSSHTFGCMKSSWNRGRECCLVLFLFCSDLRSAFIKLKKKNQTTDFEHELLWTFAFTPPTCLSGNGLPEGGLVGSFYLLSLTHGSRLHPLNSPALWHCWTEVLASERQGSSEASSASDKVMSCWFLLCIAILDVFKLNNHPSPMYATG